jgi:hypothetical protein
LPPPPQAVNPTIANAIASAPAVTLRDLEVVCILFFLSAVLNRCGDFTALASGHGRILRIHRFFSRRDYLRWANTKPVLSTFGSWSYIGDAVEPENAKLRADRVERDLVVRAADFHRRADAFDRQRVVETACIQRFAIGAGRS